MSAPFESEQTVWRRLSAKALGIPLLTGAMTFLRAWPTHRHPFNLPFTFGITAFVMALMLYAILRSNPYPRLVPAKVTADERALVIGGRTLACADIRSAVFVSGVGPGKPFVRVLPKLGLPIEIAVPSPEEGAALVRALGFDASHHALELRTFSIRFFAISSFVLMVAFVVLLLGLKGAATLAFIAILIGVLVAAFLSIGKVGVGVDGIKIRRWGRTRFIKTETIDDVQKTLTRAGSATIQTKNGEKVEVLFGGGNYEQNEANHDLIAFIERVEEVLRVYRSGAPASVNALLDRGSRDVRDWIEKLRALGTGASATLRTAAIGPDQLVRVVESPSARPIDRAAAAVAIQSSGDEDAKARVRVAVNATADDKLRVALDTIAEGDDERIEAVLGALER